MRASIPQFIDVEDKVVGPFTIKQFLWLLLGGGIAMVEYSIFTLGIFIVLAVPTIGFSAALAFAKVNGKPFYVYLASLAGFYSRPQERIWKRIAEVKKVGSAKITVHKKVNRTEGKLADLSNSNLDALSALIDADRIDEVRGVTSQPKDLFEEAP